MHAPECPVCHVAVAVDDHHCPACGAALSPPSNGASPAPEGVVGVVSNAQIRMGFLRQASFNLVVTPSRIVAARMTSAMLREEAKRASANAKASGKGILKRMAATMASGLTFHERYLQMTPDQALSEHESNFVISAADIRTVKARTHQMHEDGHRRRDDLIIKTNAGRKYRFRLAPHAAANAKKMMRSAFGDRAS
jgi:hypothetical protein